MPFVKNILTELRDIVAPPRCIRCLQETTWYCTACREDARFGELTCLICETKHPRGVTCRDCRQRAPIIGTVTVDSYHALHLRRAIHWLKFKQVRPVAGVLGSLLASRLTVIAPIAHLREEALLVPVPLHPRKARQRGFNQSEDIANAVKEHTGIGVRRLLLRERATYAQAKLPAELRERNIAHAFRTVSPIQGDLAAIQHIILIDDVITSGATITAAAGALHTALPHIPIWAAAIARG